MKVMNLEQIRKVTAVKERITDFFENSQLGCVIAAIVGIALIILYASIFFSSAVCEGGCWREFDLGGRGGNPQEGYIGER